MEKFNYSGLPHLVVIWDKHCGIYTLANSTELTCTLGRAFKTVTLQATPEGQCTDRLSPGGPKVHRPDFFFFCLTGMAHSSVPSPGELGTTTEGVPRPIESLDKGRGVPKKPPEAPGVKPEGRPTDGTGAAVLSERGKEPSGDLGGDS